MTQQDSVTFEVDASGVGLVSPSANRVCSIPRSSAALNRFSPERSSNRV